MLKVNPRGGHDQFAVLDTLDPDQFVGDLLDIPDSTADDQDLQAVVGIQMDMQGRD